MGGSARGWVEALRPNTSKKQCLLDVFVVRVGAASADGSKLGPGPGANNLETNVCVFSDVFGGVVVRFGRIGPRLG